MCGLVGIAGDGIVMDPSSVEKMSAIIAHRGPDQSGLYFAPDRSPAVAMATRRLAILDLSPEGSQPMSNETGDIWLAYNGEIYNHLELRGELQANYSYHSSTDTETVVHAYEQWDAGAFDRLRGMFALALHDRRSGKLVLARDRRGIKPLYYTWDGRRLAFASEIKALTEVMPGGVEVDPTGLWLFLCLGYVPSPYSIVAGVRKLEPGHYLELHDGQIKITPFAPDARRPEPIDDEREAARLVRESLEGAVQRHLMSDVPVGVFLSGGLDSTIVATMAAQYHREPLHTFSIGYAPAPGAGEIASQYNDDFLFARQVARSLGTIHHEVIVENDAQLLDLMPRLVFQLDEPMVEPVFTSTHHLSRLARECGVPVVLTGDGADELFGGYNRYFAAQRLATYRQLPGLSRVLPFVETAGGSRDLAVNARELRYLLSHQGAVESYIRFSSIYRPEQALELLAPNVRSRVDTQALARLVEASLGQARPFVDQMGHADLVLWVGEHFNPRLDRISMLHSVEARVPFQDDAVVAAALSIPTALKSNSRSRKKLLKRAFADILPDAARTRPKRSFQAPGAAWLQGGLQTVYSRLVDGDNHLTELFDPIKLRAYANGKSRETPGVTFSAWALLAAELWAEQYLNKETLHA